jgi:multicomponent Na+:H+ antiporter subunit C
MTAAIAVGILVAAGVYLILQRGLVRVIIGFVALGHAANIILVSAGGMAQRDAPLVAGADESALARMADPLPQAFVLTAIVITFGITVYLLGLARAGGDDDPDPRALDPDAPDDPAGDDYSGTGTDAGDGTTGAEPDADAAPDRSPERPTGAGS